MKKYVKNEECITIHGFMINKLNLKGNDLLVYAIIYDFSKAKGTVFNESLQYLADWTNSTRRGVVKNLENLMNKKLIGKVKSKVMGAETVGYFITDLS